MRLLGRVLFLLVVLGVVGAVTAALQSVIARLDVRVTERAAERMTQSIAYALDTESWTRFPFSNPPRRVRLVSNAELPLEALGSVDRVWRYAIEYQVLNATGGVLDKGALNFEARLPAFRNPETGEVVAGSAYAQRPALPSALDLTVLDLAKLEGAAEFRARVADLGPEVLGAALRVYERQPVRERQAAVAWQRMDADDRARLAHGNVFPPRLLRPEEREALVRNAWSPIGPSGVEGTDYRSVTVLTRGEAFRGEQVREDRSESGVVISPERKITVPLPEGESLVSFSVSPVGDPSTGSLAVRWFGRGRDAREERNFPLEASRQIFEARFEGGLIELFADVPLRVEVFVPGADGRPRELTSELGAQRVYGLEGGEELMYPIAGLPGEPTPFRLVLRCACEAGEAQEVRFAIMEEGGTLKEGTIALTPEPSPYDRLVDEPAQILSEPQEVFFNLPPETEELRLTSDGPVFVAGFNRPPGLPRSYMIPEDYFASDAGNEKRPTWYAVRPAEWDARVAAADAPLLLAPPRPPEDDPEVLSGVYDWEQFVPEGDWLARDLVLPRERESASRPRALASAYVPLKVAEAVKLEFASPLGGETVSPELMYLRPEGEPAEIRVLLDGEEVVSTLIGAARGTVPLPPLPAGTHLLEVSAPGSAQIYVNHVADASGTVLRRSAIRLPEGEISFEVEKRSHEEELLVAQVLPQATGPGRQSLRLSLGVPERRPGPFSSWTISERRYSIRLGPEEANVPVLGADQVVGPARTLFIALGSDLPPGRYPVTVALEEGPEVYLVLSRTTPGIVARRNVVQE